VKVRVDTQEREFRVDNVQGPWDVSARLREVFAFVQDGLRGTEVDLREVEYAACNGMLHTLDPHSVLLSPEAYKEMNLSTSGQFGRFASIVAEARDPNGTGFVRRLELTQESFAKYAYWSNSENNASGGTIVSSPN